MNRICIVASTLAVAALCTAGPALARDQLQIAGSSTVLPYAQIVAEDFGKAVDIIANFIPRVGYTERTYKVVSTAYNPTRALSWTRRTRPSREMSWSNNPAGVASTARSRPAGVTA